MNVGYDVNQALQSLFQMKNAGRNPQQIMQMLIQQNPQIKNTRHLAQYVEGQKSTRIFLPTRSTKRRE